MLSTICICTFFVYKRICRQKCTKEKRRKNYVKQIKLGSKITVLWDLSHTVQCTVTYTLKERDRLDRVVELRVQYWREIFQNSLETNQTVYNCLARVQIQSLKSSWIIHSRGILLDYPFYRDPTRLSILQGSSWIIHSRGILLYYPFQRDPPVLSILEGSS